MWPRMLDNTSLWSILEHDQQRPEHFALDQRGVLMLIEHNPAEFKLLGEREVTKEESWAHLAIAGDKVLVRHLKGIQCYSWKCLGRNASKASRHAL